MTRRQQVVGLAAVAVVAIAAAVWRSTSHDERSALTSANASAQTSPRVSAPQASAPRSAPAPSMNPVDDALPAIRPSVNFKTQMRSNVTSIEPQIAECAKRSFDAGQRYTGTAMLYVLAGRDDDGDVKLESTGVDDDETTIEDDALLACLHELGRSMPAFEIAVETDSVHAHWRVDLDHGVVTASRISDYSFRKDSDGPLD